MMRNLTLQEIIEMLDIKTGQPLMISSDITKLWAEYRKTKTKFVPQEFIELLQKKVTKDGTLIFPTYSWDFCHGEGFDYYKTIPRTGGLGRVSLSMPGFRRTQHPIYSFAVWGKDADKLCKMNNISSFGNDSPFSYFNEQAVDHLMIGIPFTKGFTFAHYVEELIGVPYRYLKDFEGKYVDDKGVESIRTYSMNVRDLDLDVINSEGISHLLEENVRQKAIFYDVEFRIINYADAFPKIFNDIKYNKARSIAEYKGQ